MPTVRIDQVVRTEDGAIVQGVFAPAAMRIHPLTHADTGADGGRRVVLHMELKDAWGDTVKGVGSVQIQLRRRDTGRIGESGARWDIDLVDLDVNTSYFDSATRTYKFVLGNPPAWIEDEARVRVLFSTTRPNGDAVVLQDEYELR